MQRSDGRSARYSVLSRFYVISIIAHMFLVLLALLIYLPVIEPPPVEIQIDLAAGAQLLDSAIAEGKMALLINQLESYDKKLAEVEAAEKALKEALGQYGEELIDDFAGDFEIGGDTDPGFDSGLSFQTGQELVELGKEAVEPLLDSLDNFEDDSKTRRRTAKVLAMLGEKRAIPTLVERFAAGDKAFWGIQLAMNKLAADDPKNAKVIGNELIRRTKDPEQMAKMAKNWLFVGATTVGGEKKYEKQIERFLIDGDKKTRDAWFSMAPHFGTLRKNTQRTLARLLLYDEDEDTRLQAATAIGYSGWDVEVVDELKRAFKTDKSVKVRSALLRTLNATAQDDRTAINIEATKDSSSQIRSAGAHGLSSHYGSHALSSAERRQAVSALRALMADRDISVRRSAASALGDLKARESLPELVKALESADANLRGTAMYSMFGIAATSALDRDTIDSLLEFAAKPKMSPEGKGYGQAAIGTRWRAMALVTRYAPRDDAIAMLRDQLKQSELRTRTIAIAHLVSLNATEAVPDIAKLAHHAQLGLRGRALWALGRMRQRQYIPMMIEQLHDQDVIGESGSVGVYGVDGWAKGSKKLPLPYGIYPDSYNPRSAIVQSLRLLGATEAIPDLIRLTEAHLHPGIRMEMATLLREWTHLDQRIVPTLVRMAEDIHPQSQLKIIDWLGQIGDKRALPFLRKLLTGEFKKPTEVSPFALAPMEDRTVWSATVSALVRMGDETIVPYLKKELSKASGKKRAQIADSLRRLGGEEGAKLALETYRKQLDDEDASVAADAAVALAGMGDESMVEKMKKLAKAMPADATRLNVLRALIQLGHREGVPMLLSEIIGNRKGSHHTPLHALILATQIKGVECIPTIVKRIIEEEGMYFFRYRGAAALIAMGHPDGIEALIHKKLMKGPHAYGGWVVMEGLGRFKDKRVVRALIEYLEDRNDLIRMRAIAAKSLGRIGDAEAIPVLVNQLRDHQMTGHAAPVRVNSAHALASIRASNPTEDVALAVVGPLLEVARSERDLSVRRAAMSALAEMKVAEAMPLFIEALTDKNDNVRRSVAGTLSVSTGIDFKYFADAVRAYPNNPQQVETIRKLVTDAQAAAPQIDTFMKAIADDQADLNAYLQLATLYDKLGMRGKAAGARRRYVRVAGDAAKPEILSKVGEVVADNLGDQGSWWFIGPFQWKGFDVEYPPETRIQKEAYLGKRKDILTWRKVNLEYDAGGEIVCGFGRFVSGQYTDSVFFIYRVIFSESKRSAELRFGSDDGIKVWFNGKEVLSNDTQRSMLRDQDKAAVTFNKGANRLLIRINNGRSGGGFIFRVTDAVGTPIVVDLEGTLQ